MLFLLKIICYQHQAFTVSYLLLHYICSNFKNTDQLLQCFSYFCDLCTPDIWHFCFRQSNLQLASSFQSQEITKFLRENGCLVTQISLSLYWNELGPLSVKLKEAKMSCLESVRSQKYEKGCKINRLLL